MFPLFMLISGLLVAWLASTARRFSRRHDQFDPQVGFAAWKFRRHDRRQREPIFQALVLAECGADCSAEPPAPFAAATGHTRPWRLVAAQEVSATGPNSIRDQSALDSCRWLASP